jgi:pSer/pThr/pTyr-binding forkhead associated (FHA) protein
VASKASGRGGRREPTEFVGGSPPTRPSEQSSLLETVRGEAHLVVASGSRREAEFALRGEEISIGRDPEADVPIDEPSASRRHAVIVRRRDGYYLRDLGSTNGTYLFGLLRGREKRLLNGDRFRIGRTALVFYDPESEESE